MTPGKLIFIGLAVCLACSCRSVDSAVDGSATVMIGGPDSDYPSLAAALAEAPVEVSHFLLAPGIHTESGLVIGRNVTILGTDARRTVLQGAVDPQTAPDRVLTILEGTEVTVRNLTIRHGLTREILRRGGGILNLGTLRMDSCLVTANAAVYGAGLDNRGRATISHSVFSGNMTIPRNIEERTTAVGCLGSGGGIKNEPGGILVMEDCEISGNTTLKRGGALFVSCESRAVLNRCLIRDNHSAEKGGGIYLRGDLTLLNSRIIGNSSQGSGGGLVNSGFLDFSDNTFRGNAITDFAVDTGTLGVYGGGVIGIDERNRIGSR